MPYYYLTLRLLFTLLNSKYVEPNKILNNKTFKCTEYIYIYTYIHIYIYVCVIISRRIRKRILKYILKMFRNA